MPNTRRKIALSAAELFVLAGLMVAVPVIVKIDSAATGHGPAEWSLTELTQEALLALSAVVFWLGAWKRPQARGSLVLVAGLFTTMLVREIDFFLDKIAKGFWVYPASVVAIAVIIYAARCRGTVIVPMADYMGNRFFNYILTGLLIVIVFSRAFGTSSLWQTVMGEQYDPVYKTVIQEGLELLGYVLIFYGSVLFVLRDEPHQRG